MSSRRKLFLLVALPLLLVFTGVYFLAGRSPIAVPVQTDSSESEVVADTETAGDCSTLLSPADFSQATSVLLPGQERGGHYKAHGGLRFDGLTSNEMAVKAPLPARVTAGSRYIEMGEVQYLFDFTTDCGLEYRLDHLKTLSPKFQSAAEQLPEPKVDDSRTSNLSNLSVTAGEQIATAVGFEKLPDNANKPNVFFDFGVYDRRQQNQAAKNPTWAAAHQAEKDQAYHAVCWFNLLTGQEATQAAQLVQAAYQQGETSDYCQ